MAGKELGRREAWCLAAGTVLFNALVTMCIVGVALPRAGSPGAGAGAGLLDGGAAAATGAHSRKLQQVFVEVDPQFQAWKASVFDPNFALTTSSSAITITKKVRFLGGIEVTSGSADFNAAKVTVSSSSSLTAAAGSTVTLSSASSTGSKLSVTPGGVELVADKATVGNSFASPTTVLKVYGNVQVGKDGSGTPYQDRTVIYPGKTSMSWSGNGGALAKAWLGKAADDPATKEQLSVYGTTTLGSATRDAPQGQLVARVYGNIQLGKPASGNGDIVDRTTIYPGKVSCSWAGPAGPKQLAKAYIGKAFDDAQTKDQLSVFGSATLGTSRTKPFVFNSTGYFLQN
ncbi:hypothetical protein ABPG77_005448 [Micractinium sp. CCAP 211/92]